MKLRFTYKGGPGSGHFEHEGRPGKVGGSLSSDQSGGSGNQPSGWSSNKYNEPQFTKGRARATIQTINDGRSNYLAILWQDTESDRYYFEDERFATYESEHSEASKITDSDMERARQYVTSNIDSANEKFSKPLPKPKRRPRKRHRLPYYD